MGQMIIRLAKRGDISRLLAHHKRHISESGNDGDIIFAPVEKVDFKKDQASIDLYVEKLSKEVTEENWERCWIVTDEKKIFGSLTLRHFMGLKSSLHWAQFMMGIERSERNKGLGSQLVKTALEWAKSNPSLEWVNLRVFAHNTAALNLYKKFGFIQSGITKDLFRIKNQKIDDIEMFLSLKT